MLSKKSVDDANDLCPKVRYYGDVGRHENEITWTSFGGVFKFLAPSHSSFAFHYVDHALRSIS